jgi:uncharacterized membrane protein YoaK (UPF0700 family)
VDAVSYLRLGKVFTANMTGNTVLLGIAVVQGHGGDAARSAAALVGFCAGALAGAVLRGARAGFAAEGALLVAMAVLGPTGALGHVPLVAIGGCTMGLQAGTVRPRNTTGVNVTYITGTLTSLMARVADRALRRAPAAGDPPPGPGLPAAVWAAYAAGGLTGAAAAGAWHTGAFALPAVAALLVALAPQRRPRPRAATSA